jgi:hypothetical protein
MLNCRVWHDVVTARLKLSASQPGQTPTVVVRGPAAADAVMAGGSGLQAVQVDGISPPPVGRADPIPDATGELDDPRLAGRPTQAEQFADRRGSAVRSQYH